MRSRRTPTSNQVYRLDGGTEDNDLHVRVGRGLPGLRADDPASADPYIASVWEPDPEERAAIASGANLELVIYGTAQPPVSLGVTREQPTSRPQRAFEVSDDTPRIWAELPAEGVAVLIDVITTRLDARLAPLLDQHLAYLLELHPQLEAALASAIQAHGGGSE